jgi:hypothetical protein
MTPVRTPIAPNITAVAIVALLVMMGLALALAGCGGDVTTTTNTAPTTTAATAVTTTAATAATTTTTAPVTTSVPSTETTTTSEPSTTTTTEALSSAETRLPDGTIKGMGFIDRVWEAGGVRYLSIDYAEFLTGEEARQAAIEAGYIQPDEDLPNDYFIRNVNTKLREFTVSPSVAITTATRVGGGMDQPATWDEFMSFWSASPPEGAAHMSKVPWWIIRDGGQVIKIDEQYVP